VGRAAVEGAFGVRTEALVKAFPGHRRGGSRGQTPANTSAHSSSIPGWPWRMWIAKWL
jgi:hypothetical protein